MGGRELAHRYQACNIYIAFLSKVLYNSAIASAMYSPTHTHIQTLTAVSIMQGNSWIVGALVGVRRLAQGHLDSWLGGVGD